MNVPANLDRFDRVELLQEAVASAFSELVTETLQTADTFRVSLSGGSTPKRIYELISHARSSLGSNSLVLG